MKEAVPDPSLPQSWGSQGAEAMSIPWNYIFGSCLTAHSWSSTGSTFTACSAPHWPGSGLRCVPQPQSSVQQVPHCPSNAMVCHPLCWTSEGYGTILVAIQCVTYLQVSQDKEQFCFLMSWRVVTGRFVSLFSWHCIKFGSFPVLGVSYSYRKHHTEIFSSEHKVRMITPKVFETHSAVWGSSGFFCCRELPSPPVQEQPLTGLCSEKQSTRHGADKQEGLLRGSSDSCF